jgi:hypothetical protein
MASKKQDVVSTLTDEQLQAELERRRLAKVEAAEREASEKKSQRERLKKDGSARIAKAVEKAHDAIKEAIAVSEETGVEFYFSVDYGMGGTYVPAKVEGDDDSGWSSLNQGWQSSSSRC